LAPIPHQPHPFIAGLAKGAGPRLQKMANLVIDQHASHFGLNEHANFKLLYGNGFAH